MKIKRFRHIALIVKSMDSMLTFYQDVLGCVKKRDFVIGSEEFRRGIGIPDATARCVHLTIPNSDVEIELFEFHESSDSLTQPPRINDPGYRHFAIVVEDMDEAVTALKRKGVVFHSNPIRFEQPADIRGFSFVYIRDPEGNIIEINQLPNNA